MPLWNWIAEYLLPLFGDVPTIELNLGHLGTLTIENILQIMFWVTIGYVCVNVLVLLPYEWCMRLFGRKRCKK